MGEMGGPFFNGPVLHHRGHGIGDGGIHTFAEGNGLVQRFIHSLGQALTHDAVIENIAAENIRGSGVRKIERSHMRLVGGDGLDGAVAGGITAHACSFNPREMVRIFAAP